MFRKKKNRTKKWTAAGCIILLEFFVVKYFLGERKKRKKHKRQKRKVKGSRKNWSSNVPFNIKHLIFTNDTSELRHLTNKLRNACPRVTAYIFGISTRVV